MSLTTIEHKSNAAAGGAALAATAGLAWGAMFPSPSTACATSTPST